MARMFAIVTKAIRAGADSFGEEYVTPAALGKRKCHDSRGLKDREGFHIGTVALWKTREDAEGEVSAYHSEMKKEELRRGLKPLEHPSERVIPFDTEARFPSRRALDWFEQARGRRAHSTDPTF